MMQVLSTFGATPVARCLGWNMGHGDEPPRHRPFILRSSTDEGAEKPAKAAFLVLQSRKDIFLKELKTSQD
jgi:hypothetical protein